MICFRRGGLIAVFLHIVVSFVKGIVNLAIIFFFTAILLYNYGSDCLKRLDCDGLCLDCVLLW